MSVVRHTVVGEPRRGDLAEVDQPCPPRLRAALRTEVEQCLLPARPRTAPRPWPQPSPRSTRASVRDPSCAWGTSPVLQSPSSRRGRSPLTWLWESEGSRGDASSRSTGRSPPERPPSPCTPWPARRGPAGTRLSSTPSTPSTRSMPRPWASTSTTSWSHSRTPGSRPWRSPTCWCAQAAWTSSSSTPWRPWSPRPRSRGRWGTPTSASKPAS